MPAVAETNRLPNFFARYQPVIDAALRTELHGVQPGLRDAHRYHMGWADAKGADVDGAQGKRLRPAVALLGADAVGGDPTTALPVATALEYVHNFSLIHDDIEDGDQFRHHRPTVWVVWGEPVAIVAGNAMLKVADRAARELADRNVAPDTAVVAQRAIAEAYLSMIEGQFMDIAFEARLDVTISEYLAMIERKTGALIEASLRVGGIVASNGGIDARVIDGLHRVGFALGRLFQIRDDILGVWGSDETGKPVCGDILNRKKSLPAVHVLSSADAASAERFRAIYEQPELDGADVETALDIMDACKTYEYCDAMSIRHWETADQVIRDTGFASNVHADFEELGAFLIGRTS